LIQLLVLLPKERFKAMKSSVNLILKSARTVQRCRIRNHVSRTFSSADKTSSPNDYVQGSTTHFGYENVPIEEKESKVRSVFKNVAESYDVMNDLMSGGLHRFWKDELLSMTGVGPITTAMRSSIQAKGDFSILDVAGGTGDVAFRFLEAAGCPERAKSSGLDDIKVTVCDINPDMLRVGERRARERYGNAVIDQSRALTFQEGNAQYLPFEDNSFDVYTIAFGLRNVTDVDMALRDALRVLKPGGRFLCLEFSHVTNPAFAAFYDTYSFNVIPAVGEVVANDRESYQYLVESIRKFCTQEELKARLEKAGFSNSKYTNMTGGIVAVHEGWKPLD
jgi:ubiquinone/menaquinone biosynthesis methyltransferase